MVRSHGGTTPYAVGGCNVSDLAPCVRCGRLLHTGEGRVLVSFTPLELAELAEATSDRAVKARLVCALDLIDPDLAESIS